MLKNVNDKPYANKRNFSMIKNLGTSVVEKVSLVLIYPEAAIEPSMFHWLMHSIYRSDISLWLKTVVHYSLVASGLHLGSEICVMISVYN